MAQKCLKISKDLKEELDKMKWKAEPGESCPKTERSVLSQTWKFGWAKSKMERLQKEMRGVEQTMQSSILTDMWLSKEAALIQQKDSFKGLDDRLQQFICQYAQGNRNLSELVVAQATATKDEVSSENIKTRDQIAAQLQLRESAQVVQEQCDKFLNSLVHDTMTARKSRVTESHVKTFQWVFDDTVARPWDSFMEWLKSDDRIYWISGKPGSGKSTLMKFLVDDHRTQVALRVREPSAAIVSFFLWNAGSPMQRSVQGLLSAILYQILSMNRDLIPHLLRDQPDLAKKFNYSQWSDKELELVLVRSISMSPQPLCIFLDGLDEIDRDEGCLSIVDLTERLRSNTTAKLCISSRPEVEFKAAFRGYPTLRLQDLTAKDISNFVGDFLQNNFQFEAMDDNGINRRRRLIKTVLERADGVFLWVHLVLRSLRRGGVHIDSYKQLSERITHIPSKLEELYKESWSRHGEDETLYRVQAAQYFKLVLEARNTFRKGSIIPFTLFEFAVASSNAIQKATLEGKSLPSVKSLVQETEKFCRRIESRCGGLLEVWSHDPSPSDEDHFTEYVESLPAKFLHQFIIPMSAYVDLESESAESLPNGSDLAALWNVAYHGRLDFIHRTAADFLLNTNFGRSIIDCDPATSADVRVRLYRSRLIHALFFTFPLERNTGLAPYRSWSLILIELQDLCRDISNEMGQNLLAQLEDVYETLLDRAHAMDHIVTQIRLQIRNGQFDVSYCEIMCNFIDSYTVESLRFFYTRDELKGISGRRLEIYSSRAGRWIDAIRKACLQVVASYASNAAEWPADIPKFLVPHSVVPSSDDLLGYIFAEMFFITWVLLDARVSLRWNSTYNVLCFVSAAARMGMRDTLKRCFEGRTNLSVCVENVKELLLFEASYNLADSPRSIQILFPEGTVWGSVWGSQEWRNDETICWLLQEGADPNWRCGPEYSREQQLSLFEWSLLSVPDVMRSSTEASVGCRIFTTIQAYIKGGANLDRIICLCRGARGSATWRRQREPRISFTKIRNMPDWQYVRFEITAEFNICQLVQNTKSFIEDHLARQDPDIQYNLSDLGTGGYNGYRKVLCVSKIVEPSRSVIHCAAASPGDSDDIFGLLDSERVSERWTSQVFEAELQSLLERILETDEKVGSFETLMSSRGHKFENGIGDLESYARAAAVSKTRQLYAAIFPNLTHEEHTESEDAALEAVFLNLDYKRILISRQEFPDVEDID